MEFYYYEDASILNEQINKPDTYNIAVMAKYGAGKSSLINTYLSIYRSKDIKKNNHKEVDAEKINDKEPNEEEKLEETKSKKDSSEIKNNKIKLGKPIKNNYARISLSTFNKTDFDEVAIERSILQQLLYSRKKSKLPNSKIERTNKTSLAKSFFFAALLTVFILTAILTSVEFSLYAREFNKGISTLFCGQPWIKYILLAITFCLLFVIVLWILHYRKLRKIKYKDLEADFVHDNEKGNDVQITNLINRFIDEVLYFFECIDIDLVIFEDLDRLPTTEIFVKLRELNTIINNSNKCKKKVTFLYAVKDDLFKTEEERAKFFEFILPVVPIINPVTTVSEIEKKLRKIVEKNKEMKLSSKLIKGVSIYIPDMRVLKNTVNDYIIMYRKIFEDKYSNQYLDHEKLFALCVYKNLFPYDYTLLEQNEGLIPKIIDIKALHTKLTENIDAKIKNKEKEISVLQSERLRSFSELQTMLNGQLCKYGHCNRGGNYIDVSTIKTFEGLDFTNLLHPSNMSYCVNIDKEILTPSGERYIDREKRINEIEKAGVEKLRGEISELEKEKHQIFFWTLKDIIEIKGVDICFDEAIKKGYISARDGELSPDNEDLLSFIKEKWGSSISERDYAKLKEDYKEKVSAKTAEKQREQQYSYLRFILRYNYIDEHFIEYTSNYKSEKLSQTDTKAAQLIQSGHHEFNLQVENPKEFVEWIDEEEFKHIPILIKRILVNIEELYAISRKDKDNKYDNLLHLLSNTEQDVIGETLIEFLCCADYTECENLLKRVLPIRPSLCAEALESNKLDADKRNYVVSEFIKYIDDYKIDESKYVARYVESQTNYLEIFNAVNDDQKVINFIREQEVILMYLSAEQLDDIIQQYIITNSMYDLTVENLAVVLAVQIDSGNSDFYSKNYDMILNSGKKYLIDYVKDNIDNYVEDILLDDKITCENEPADIMSDLLTSDKIDIEVRKNLIKKIRVKLSDISIFDTALYQAMFNCDVVEASWRNIQLAFEKKGFETVKDFIIRTPKIVGQFVSLDGVHSDTPINLINSILINFKEDDITAVSKTMPVVALLSAIKIAEIGDNKLAAYINEKKIQYTKTDLTILMDLPRSLNCYLKIHKEKIMEEFDTFFAEALPTVTTQRQPVGGYWQNVQTIKERANSQKLIAAVLSCQDVCTTIKNTLIEKCVDIINIKGYEQIYADYIIKEWQGVPAKILWQFSNFKMSLEDKIKILEICRYGGEGADPKDIKDYLISMTDSFAKIINEHKRAAIPKSDATSKLLSVLLEKKFIEKYEKVRKKEEYWVS